MTADTYNFVLHASACSNNCIFCGGQKIGKIDVNVRAEQQKLESVIHSGAEIERVEISGNDPLEYDGLEHVVTWIRTRTRASISLSTHGRRLAGRRLTSLLRAGVNLFTIPLYGATAPVHAAVTGVAASFAETLPGVADLVSRRVPLSLTTLVTRQNMDSLTELFLFLGKLVPRFFVGVPLFYVGAAHEFAPSFAEITPRLTEAITTLRSLSTSQAWLRNFPRCAVQKDYPFIQQSEAPKRGYEHLRSLVGSKRLRVLADGDVIPNYRAMIKGEPCGRCRYNNECAGYYESYVASGLFQFEAIE